MGYSSKQRAKRKKLIQVREIGPEDMKYIWAAYRKDGLEEFDPVLGVDMGLEDFKQAFVECVNGKYNAIWIITGPVSGREPMPIAFVTGWVRGRILEMGHATWFPWVAPRVIFDAAEVFFERARREYFVMEFARERDQRFFDAVAKTGVIKRTARFHGMYPGEAAILYIAKV